jgi:uncharacterized protein (TIGR02594 family)
LKNFEFCLKPLLEHEGGNDDDPQDPGGRTSRGIIQTEYDKYRDRNGQSRRDVWTATDAEVRDIYLTEYWNVLHCDELPSGVDYAVFDYGVNSGVSRAAKVLQRLVGVSADGEIGPITVNATLAETDLEKLIDNISEERLSFLQQLKTWSRFGHGWATRVNKVESLALQMAADERNTNAPTVAPAPAKPTGGLLAAFMAAFMALFGKKAAPQPVPPPVPSSPASIDPPWMVWANKEVGFHEIGQNHGIDRYIALAHCGSDGDPWCAILVNAALESCGILGSRSAMARSFEHHPNFVKLDGPAFGAIVTMWRGSPDSGSGHVFFYAGENDRGILALGGNQSDKVCRQYEPRNRVEGYFWPKSVPLPKIGKIIVKSDADEGTET